MPGSGSQKMPEGGSVLDREILGLLIRPHYQRPWSETEIERELRSAGIAEGLARLSDTGLVHRAGDLWAATYAAVRRHELDLPDDNPLIQGDRQMEQDILSLLVTARGTPISEQEIARALSITNENRLAVVDALDRLDRAGLVDRRDGLAVASDAAVHYDAIEAC